MNKNVKINIILSKAFESVKEDLYYFWLLFKKNHNKWFCYILAFLINLFILIIGITIAPFLIVLYIVFGLKVKPWELFIGHI